MNAPWDELPPEALEELEKEAQDETRASFQFLADGFADELQKLAAVGNYPKLQTTQRAMGRPASAPKIKPMAPRMAAPKPIAPRPVPGRMAAPRIATPRPAAPTVGRALAKPVSASNRFRPYRPTPSIQAAAPARTPNRARPAAGRPGRTRSRVKPMPVTGPRMQAAIARRKAVGRLPVTSGGGEVQKQTRGQASRVQQAIANRASQLNPFTMRQRGIQGAQRAEAMNRLRQPIAVPKRGVKASRAAVQRARGRKPLLGTR